MKVKQKILKTTGIFLLAGLLLAGLITMVYSDRNNHYVVNVVKDTASAISNDNMKITETVEQRDAETLDYTVEVKNENEEKTEVQVALVVDTSYSMQENGADSIAKTTAKEIATALKANVTSIANLRMSVSSNSGNKLALTTDLNTVKNRIDGLTSGESQDCNNGLRGAFNAGFSNTPLTANNHIRKYIIYVTDSTDSVSAEMQRIINENSNLKIISVLVDLTSSEYMNLTTGEVPTNEYVYVLPNNVEEDDILPVTAKKYNLQDICDQINVAANEVKVENVFSPTIINYFDKESFAAQNGVLTTTEEDGKITGYTWEIGQLKFQESAKMTFTLKFKKDSEINAESLFRIRTTNATQDITYKTFDEEQKGFIGTDFRPSSVDSTSIKICEGYEIRIKAVNESNRGLAVNGLKFNVTGTDINGNVVFTKVTEATQDGYVKLTANDGGVLRNDGKVTYTITPIEPENITGYEKTDSITFAIDNNGDQNRLIIDDLGSALTPPPAPLLSDPRVIEVEVPITTTKFNIVINAQELDNSGVTLSGCEFELIQPKLNNRYEMAVITGTTDENGNITFPATVMTKEGEYHYILKQSNAPTGYEVTNLTEMIIKFDENGRVEPHNDITGEITTLYNENVKARLNESSLNSETDTVNVTVQNKCLRENPIKLQINLSDFEDNNIKISGVEYLIATHAGNVRTESMTTDENGQINTEIYGTGYITLKITERSPKVGYQRDSIEKEILLKYQDGTLTKLPDNSYGTYTTDYLLDDEGNREGLQINFTSKKKQQQNIVRVKVVEAEERDVSAGMDIIYDLVDENGINYGPKGTDVNGELAFTIGNQSEGTHTYQLIPKVSSIPSEYDLTKIDTPITIDINFNEDGFITNQTNVTSESQSIINKELMQESDDQHLYNVYDLKIAYYLKPGNTFRFNVLLKDAENKTTPLEMAKYDINIEYDTIQNGNTVTKIKQVKNRQTNSYGKVSTLITKADRVVIHVTEVSPKIGYALDNTIQEIHLIRRADGTMQIESQTPYDLGVTNTDGINAYKGAEPDADPDSFVYRHYNRVRSGGDTYVNMTISKEDLNGALVDGVFVNIKSNKLVDGNGAPLDTTIATGSQTRANRVVQGEVIYDYSEFINKIPDSFTIRVPDIEDVDEEKEHAYELEITEMDADTQNPGQFIEKSATKIKVRLIFRVKDNNIKLTNVETIYGNRLIKHKEFSSCSDNTPAGQELTALGDSLGVYLTNITLNTYTKYDDVGNLSIDLQKQNMNDEYLDGAEYDVKITNPDSTVVRKHVIVDNGEESSAIELKGVTVNVGSVISLKETKAPMGYAENEYDETLEVTEINDAGEITLTHQSNSYNPSRLEISKQMSTITSVGNLKENYVITLKDYELDTFVMGVDAVDSNSKALVGDFKFEIKTNTGAQGKVQSGNTTKVGGNPAGRTVTYTVTPKETGKYYKAIPTPIEVKVVFDASGNVDYYATMDAQTDPNYGTLWNITNLDANAEGNLKIEIYVNHQPPLTVKVNTINAITNENYTANYQEYGWYIAESQNASWYAERIQYQVTESVDLPAIGTGGQMYPGKDDDGDGVDDNGIKVGYIYEKEPNGVQYTLKQNRNLPFLNNYFMNNNVQFRLAYEDGKIDRNHVTISTLNEIERQPEIQVTGDTEVTINLYIEPSVPFEITNKEYFEPKAPLMGAVFKVAEVGNNEISYGTTDNEGIATGIYCSTFGKNSSKVYKVQQLKAATNYATVDDFFIKVEYNDNRSINTVTLIDVYGNEITDNRFIEVGFKQRTGLVDCVTIEVINYPEFKINITDIDRREKTDPEDPDTPISGTTYSVTSTYLDENNEPKGFTSANNVVTNKDGLGIAHLDKTKPNTIVTYKVKEEVPGPGYQTIEAEFEIEVTFDEDGFITGTPILKNTTEYASIASLSLPEDQTTSRFEINLELKNNPLLKLNITTKDRTSNHRVRFNRTGISDDELNDKIYELIDFFREKGEDYYVSSGFPLKEITYEFPDDWDEIKQVTWKVSMGIDDQELLQTLIENKNRQAEKTRLEEAGDPAANDIVFLPLPSTPKTGPETYDILKTRYNVTQTSNINDEYKIIESRYQLEKYNTIYVGNVQNQDNLQDFINKGLTFPITVEPGTPISDVEYKIISVEESTTVSNASATNKANLTGTPELVHTDYNGQTTAYMNRTIENKEIIYKIEMTTKGSGYEWLDDIIEVKVIYDADGKILEEPTVVRNQDDCKVIHFDSQEFVIDVDILVDEVKQFGIDLSAVDTYDPNKKLDNIMVKSFLVDSIDYSTGTHNGFFKTGKDSDNDGKPDIAHGEDYQTFGQYVVKPGATTETRVLRLIIENNNSGKPYYLDEDGNNIGYYKGSTYYDDAHYQNVKYQYLIRVTFDDEGKIIDARLIKGLNEHIGWLADERYIQTEGETLEISHTDYKLNVTMKFFPMLELKVDAMDNYFKNEDGTDFKLPDGTYTISTQRHTEGNRIADEFITAGYIGYPHQISRYESVSGDIYEGTNTLYAPIENNYTRLYYVFEEQEPTNYQHYRHRGHENYKPYEKLIAIISLVFDEKGEIDYDRSFSRYVTDNEGIEHEIPIYMNEEGSDYLSTNNLQAYNYTYTTHPAKSSTTVSIGYALTTKIKVKTVDDIDGTHISNIRVYPFVNNTYKTNTPYTYVFADKYYRSTDINGEAQWTYWGAAEPNTMDKYILGSDRSGTEYNGYYMPGDMASSHIGGSGDGKDYFANLDVTYDSNGRISAVNSLGHDLWGDANARVIGINSETGTVEIELIYPRKFQTKLNKIDFYDDTMKLDAVFDVVSNRGLTTTISNKDAMKDFGKVYKDTTVKYTLSETKIPNGYYPVEGNIDYYVTFDGNGNISKQSVQSNHEYFGDIRTSTTTKQNNKTSPDLELNIKNKQAFSLNLRVIDQFYKSIGLQNVTFNITNSKGDIAVGNPQTDKNGYVDVIASPAYNGETVTYYITQTNVANGYYSNDTTVELVVEFDEAGKIRTYYISNGGEIVNNFNGSDFLGKRNIELEIMNMPKDVKLGIHKYDRLSNEGISPVKFSITKTDMNTKVSTTVVEETTTDTSGNTSLAIDTFEKLTEGKIIKYTIHEINNPATYRKADDIEYIVRYNPDGSILSYSNILNRVLTSAKKQSNLSIATSGVMNTLENEKIHMRLDIPNDNTFDIYIVNEDTNISGFGIEGSIFDVSVNGKDYVPSATDKNGLTEVEDLTDSGDITINISQKQAGIGYRTDLSNQVTVNLIKGTDIYSLDLDEAQDGFIDSKNARTDKPVEVFIDEDYGRVYVIFKNETKTELTLLKQDYESFSALEGAQFEITGQQINDLTGDPIGDPITITTDENNTTDSKGELYFDLGVTPKQEKWVYTFREITPPEGYDPIADLTMTVVYDQNGRITIEKSTSNRIAPVMADKDENCRSMIARIYNGDIPPAYTVKVYKKDVDTGRPISGASISMNITEADTGNMVEITPKTPASAYNGIEAITGNLGLDYKMYSDEALKSSPVTIIDKGLVYIDNISDSFNKVINIEVNETAPADGYIIGDQKVNGNVKIRANYIPDTTSDPTVELELIDADGLEVDIDNVNKEVNITIKNESQIKMHIKKIVYGYNPEIEIPGVSFDVEAYEDGTTLIGNYTTPLTNDEGMTEIELGKACADKAVLYKLKEKNTQSKCIPLETDLDILVIYDKNGEILQCKALNALEYVRVDSQTDGRDIYLTVSNKLKIPKYKVQIQKRVIDDASSVNPYGKVLEGARYDVIIHQEDNGKEYTTFTETTDAQGMIDMTDLLDGTGNITIAIKEADAPEGYTIDETPRILKVYRDPNTGNVELISSNVDSEFINTDSQEYTSGQPVRIVMKPFDKRKADTYTLSINKYSSKTGMLIENNHTKFDAILVQEDEEGNTIYEDIIGELETNNEGKIELTGLKLPSDPGMYKLVLTELEAPKGYVLNSKPIELNVTIEQDVGGFSIITNIEQIAEDAQGNKVAVTEDNKAEIETNLMSLDYGNQYIELDISNNIIPGYKVQVEKHVLDTDWDLNAYERLLEGATYRVMVHEEDAGTEDVTFVATSDENGLIDVPGLVFNGFGYVTITIEELEAPDGYVKDGTTRICRIYRDPKTGNIDLTRSGSDLEGNYGVNFDTIGTDSDRYVKWEPVRVILKPVNIQDEERFTLKINKYDKETQALINTGHARFNAKFVKYNEEGEIVFERELGELETKKGIAELKNLVIPKETGEYKLILTEIQAPLGYGKLSSPIEITVDIEKNDLDIYKIKSATTDNPNTTVIARTQLIVANVLNGLSDELSEDEYSLDITKVDAQTNEPIEPMALFKIWLPDVNNTAVYTETSQTAKGPGKLDYCYIEENKDYTVRLTHLNQPTSAGTLEYTFREVVAPEGYTIIPKDLKLTIDFQYDENGKLYFANATSSDPNYLRINTQTPSPIDQSFSVDILNYLEDDGLYLKSREYLIGEEKPKDWKKGVETQYKAGDEYIWQIPADTLLVDFINNLDTNGTIKVTKPDGTEIDSDGYVGTEMLLTVTKGVQRIQLTIVVRGDASGDGRIEPEDYSFLRNVYWDEIEISRAKFMAIDLSEDGVLLPDDMSTERTYLFERM